MRINNTAFWIAANAPRVHNQVYRDGERYDVVVFFKAMDERCRLEAELIKRRGGRVVFDANVNYYEIWGDYDVANTRPTAEQQRDVVAMTELADWVVADSEYLLEVVRKITPSCSWIPDNVDLNVFRGRRRHATSDVTRLIWSGMAQKAAPLLAAADAFASVPALELTLVSNVEPAVMKELSAALPCHYVPFSERRYASELRSSDVIVSPKRLINAYELGHTEYKITPGMAIGLPAVASPQRSYATAIADRGGGLVAETDADWREALARLSEDVDLRSELGGKAAATVRERYSTPVTSRAYLELFLSLTA